MQAYNDMPGNYNDILTCKLYNQDIAISQEYVLPLKMFVRGCPFVIVETSVGMSFGMKKTKKKENNANTIESDNELQIIPNQVDREVGGDSEKEVEKEEEMRSPLLLMGQACVDSEPLFRDFSVRNEGSKVGLISWNCTASYPGLNTER
jgi:hypothetical protein